MNFGDLISGLINRYDFAIQRNIYKSQDSQEDNNFIPELLYYKMFMFQFACNDAVGSPIFLFNYYPERLRRGAHLKIVSRLRVKTEPFKTYTNTKCQSFSIS